MMLRKPILALMLSLIIAFSFIAFIQLEKNNALSSNLTALSDSNLVPNHFGLWASPAFSSQPAFEDLIKETQSPLMGNSTRTEIYNFILANPGIKFRGICNGLSIAIGTAEFHLGVLKKAGLISFFCDGKYKRFFASKKFSEKQMKLISLLRHGTTKEILKLLASEKVVSRGKLASNLSITSQGLTWQMNRLREGGVVQQNFEGIKVTYSLNEANAQALPELLCLMEQ